MKINVVRMCLLLVQILAAASLLLGSSVSGNEDHFDEFHYEREEEALVTCTHDVTPRFGKRICDCGYRNEDYVAPKFEGSTTEIELANCKSLRIRRDSFDSLFQLTKLTITNVENLILDQGSLSFTQNTPAAQLRINLINNLIEEVPSHLVQGSISELSFIRCRIGLFRPYSVTSFRGQLNTLKVIESFINRIERHAFKKFDVNEILIDDSKFISPIPSYSFYEIEVLERFAITNSSFYSLLPGSVSMKNVTNLQISNSEFENIGGESLNLQIRKSIRITGNYFNNVHEAAFQAISVDSSYFNRNSQRPVLVFHNNRIGRLENSKTLLFSDGFNVQIREVRIVHSITCQEVAQVEQYSLLVDHPDDIFFKIAGEENEFKSFNDIRRIRCMEDNFWFYLIIGSVVAAIVLVIICSLVSCYCIAQKKKQRKLNVVLPEPRTYRETQIVMQIENHGLLKTDL